MTEEEARKKWCPLQKDWCTPDKCMLWNWDGLKEIYEHGHYSHCEDKGYCGLAGKP